MIYSIPKNFNSKDDNIYKLVPIDKKLKKQPEDDDPGNRTEDDEGFSFCSFLITPQKGYNKLFTYFLTLSCCLSSMSIGSLFINQA